MFPPAAHRVNFSVFKTTTAPVDTNNAQTVSSHELEHNKTNRLHSFSNLKHGNKHQSSVVEFENLEGYCSGVRHNVVVDVGPVRDELAHARLARVLGARSAQRGARLQRHGAQRQRAARQRRPREPRADARRAQREEDLHHANRFLPSVAVRRSVTPSSLLSSMVQCLNCVGENPPEKIACFRLMLMQ